MIDGIDIETSLRRIAQEEAERLAAPLQERIGALVAKVSSLERRQTEAQRADDLLTRSEVMEYLRISERTFYRRLNRGEIPPPIQQGSMLRWKRSQVEL